MPVRVTEPDLTLVQTAFGSVAELDRRVWVITQIHNSIRSIAVERRREVFGRAARITVVITRVLFCKLRMSATQASPARVGIAIASDHLVPAIHSRSSSTRNIIATKRCRRPKNRLRSNAMRGAHPVILCSHVLLTTRYVLLSWPSGCNCAMVRGRQDRQRDAINLST